MIVDQTDVILPWIISRLVRLPHGFATENACAEYVFERHWPEGFACPVARGEPGS